MSSRLDQHLAFTDLDRHFAMLMTKLAGRDDRKLWLAAAEERQRLPAIDG